jgi:hypothetical protein
MGMYNWIELSSVFDNWQNKATAYIFRYCLLKSQHTFHRQMHISLNIRLSGAY